MEHSNESAIRAHRRIQPSAFDRHDTDTDLVREVDRPVDTPETVGSLMVALQAFCIALVLVIVLAVLPLLTPFWPQVVAFFAGVI